MLLIDILRNFSQNNLGVLRGSFLGFMCPKMHPDALLAKTMIPYLCDGELFYDCDSFSQGKGKVVSNQVASKWITLYCRF